jgi:hypothetical protein
MSEANQEEKSAEEEATLDGYLDRIAALRDGMVAEMERLDHTVKEANRRMVVLKGELERVNAVLSNSGRPSAQQQNGKRRTRSSRVEARVREQMIVLFEEQGDWTVPIPDAKLVAHFEKLGSDLGREPILSAVRRMVKNGEIIHAGPLHARTFVFTVPKFASLSMEERVLAVLGNACPVALSRKDLAWRCGGDSVAVDAALKNLVAQRRIEVVEGDGSGAELFRHIEPEIGHSLFDGADKP